MSDKFYDFWIGAYKVRLSDDEQTAEVYLGEVCLHTTATGPEKVSGADGKETEVEVSATVRAQRWIGLHRCGRVQPDQPAVDEPDTDLDEESN